MPQVKNIKVPTCRQNKKSNYEKKTSKQVKVICKEKHTSKSSDL